MAEQITITIWTDNAAFSDGPAEYEVARILRDMADKLEDRGLIPINARDINGNRCGSLSITKDR